MNFQFNTVVLKEKRRGYSYCENNDKFDTVKNLTKPRKVKVLRMPEKWPINIFSLVRKENWGVQKVNAGITRSCRLGHIVSKYVESARKTLTIVPSKVKIHMFRHTKAMHLLQA